MLTVAATMASCRRCRARMPSAPSRKSCAFWRPIRTPTGEDQPGCLGEHLIDMHEVTFTATAVERPIDSGLQIDVTGRGRTLLAIQRMLPAHARELNGLSDWRSKIEALANGIRLTVIFHTAAEIAHIRGLGLIGLRVSGSHHQPHHLAMARGEHCGVGARPTQCSNRGPCCSAHARRDRQ